MVRLKKYYAEIVGSFLCLICGMLSGQLVQGDDFSWYLALKQPFFNPPAWIFGPVWTVLYLMIGFVAGRLWKMRREYGVVFVIFLIHFSLNLAWSPLFFYFHSIGLALIDLFFLWLLLLMCMIALHRHKTIFFLLIPYYLWVTFALILNGAFYQLNVV